jgi:hypothetical protein
MSIGHQYPAVRREVGLRHRRGMLRQHVRQRLYPRSRARSNLLLMQLRDGLLPTRAGRVGVGSDIRSS